MGFQTEPPNYSSVVDYQGTPSNGEFPQFTDQNTLAGRTATQFLDALATGVTPAELGYLNTVTSNVQTQLDARIVQLPGGTLTSDLTPAQLTTLAGDAKFYSGFYENVGTVPGSYASVYGFNYSANAYGYCWQISRGPEPSHPMYVRYAVNGTTWGSWQQIAAFGSDGSFTLAAGALSGVTTINHSGAQTMSGSPASAGASVRNRHGNGGTTDIVDNVSSSGGIRWTQNGTTILGFDSAKAATVDATFGASLAAAIGAGAVTGSIALWGTGSAPTGYLICDGSAVSRTTYATLFALIGTTFGAGNGSTTFNLPDFRGRAPIGAGTGSGLTARTLAGTVGAETHTLTGAESGLPAHSHTTANKGAGTGPGNQPYPAHYSTDNSWTGSSTSTAGPTSASNAHNNMQPSLVINFIIKT